MVPPSPVATNAPNSMGCVAVTVMVLGGRPGWAYVNPANIRSIAVANNLIDNLILNLPVSIFHNL
jgi:hypothetical protein